jgi:spore coat polysaccharide biosynthesis predicted glycosyltransferase SpsG
MFDLMPVQDKAEISADKRSLVRVGLLKKEIAKMRMRVSKYLKGELAGRKKLKQARVRLVRDEGRLSEQHKNVAKLLKDANQFADEAESSLKKSQVLRLNSESTTEDSDTASAAADFQDAGKQKRLSSTMTRKALDYRSRARLGQEYVQMLTTIVAKDKKAKVADKSQVSNVRQCFAGAWRS